PWLAFIKNPAAVRRCGSHGWRTGLRCRNRFMLRPETTTMGKDELPNEQPQEDEERGAEEQLSTAAGNGAQTGTAKSDSATGDGVESDGAQSDSSGQSASGNGSGKGNGAGGEHAARPTRPADIAPTVETSAAETQTPALPYPVVAFGASAGGLQACKEVLEHLDPQTGMAFVLVTHLAPDQRSYLSEIVERYTQMPVLSVEDGERPLADHLYVVLPNQSVTLLDGMFRVEPRPANDRIPRTIDKFFYSLAADQKNHAIGVVLSGADADGALGLKAIKGEGGIAIVQTPESAAQRGMPRSSIAADHVDLVIPPAEIAAELVRLGSQFTRPEVHSLQLGAVPVTDEQTFLKILQQLR